MKVSEYLKSKCSTEQYYNFFGRTELLPKTMDKLFLWKGEEKHILHYKCNKCGDTFELNNQDVYSSYCFHCGKGLLQLYEVQEI